MALFDFLTELWSDDDTLQQFQEDPQGTLNVNGFGNVTSQEIQEQMPRVLEATQGNQSVANQGGGPVDFSGSGVVNLPPPPHASAYADAPDGGGLSGAIETINHYTNVTNLTEQTYEDNDTSVVNDQDTIIDNSVNQNIDAFGDVIQDFDNDVVTGDGAVAAGDNAQVQTGDGVQAGGNISDSTIATGDVTDSTLTGDVSDSIVGTGNTGIAGSDVSGNVAFGDGDITDVDAENANLGDGTIVDDVDGNVNTGSGQQINVEDSTVSESSLGGGDVQSNDVAIDVDGDGAAVAFGDGDASGSYSDNDTTVEGNNYGDIQNAGNDATQDIDQS
ncbi:MAG TPA: IniB N-terminal domain-containing protein, partial [Acidimicrobiales bacterium]